MLYYNDGSLIVSIDQGNYNIKSAEVVFPSAYFPASGDGDGDAHLLHYDKRLYVLGGERVKQNDDKDNEDFLILTLFGIARELEQNGIMGGSHSIYLGLTLPPAYMKIKDMRMNLKQFYRREVAFKYNKRSYKINIRRVFVLPQAESALYAYVLTEEMEKHMAKLAPEQQEVYRSTARPIDIFIEEPIGILIDIGGGTTDVSLLHNGVPQPLPAADPAKGVIYTYDELISNIRTNHGRRIDENTINRYLRGEKNIRISSPEADDIRNGMARYSNNLLGHLREKQLPFSYGYALTLGGGVSGVRESWSGNSIFTMLDFLTDIRATAKGCEQLVKRMLDKGKGIAPESKVG